VPLLLASEPVLLAPEPVLLAPDDSVTVELLAPVPVWVEAPLPDAPVPVADAPVPVAVPELPPTPPGPKMVVEPIVVVMVSLP